MSIRCRPMRPNDVAGAVAILASNPVAAGRYGEYIRSLGSAWLRLMSYEAFQALVYEEMVDSQARMIAASASAFVTDDFLLDLKTPPFLWVGPEMVRRIMSDRSPVLTDTEFSKSNTRGGLNLVLWHVCVAPEVAMRPEVRAQVSGSFFEYHRGFLLKELLATQATFIQEVQWILDGGGVPLSPINGQYVDSFDSSTALEQPHLFGVTRELAQTRMNWIGSLFLYEPPRIGLAASERKLLAAALGGATDEELSCELAISLSAVKKAWQSAYERAARCLPKAEFNHDKGETRESDDRGKQKKQKLLAYLRGHPEELRPFSMRLLRQGVQATSSKQASNLV